MCNVCNIPSQHLMATPPSVLRVCSGFAISIAGHDAIFSFFISSNRKLRLLIRSFKLLFLLSLTHSLFISTSLPLYFSLSIHLSFLFPSLFLSLSHTHAHTHTLFSHSLVLHFSSKSGFLNPNKL